LSQYSGFFNIPYLEYELNDWLILLSYILSLI
jgi:hypothetical protein